MSDSKDYLEKYDAAKDEVLKKTVQLSKQAAADAYADLLVFLQAAGYDADDIIVESVQEQFGKTLFGIFYQEQVDNLKPAINAFVNEAGLKHGLTVPLDIVGKGN